jgi:hypothetical protein
MALRDHDGLISRLVVLPLDVGRKAIHDTLRCGARIRAPGTRVNPSGARASPISPSPQKETKSKS